MKNKDRDIWKIKWVDSSLTHGWRQLDEYKKPDLECVTVGYLIESNDRSVTIASSLCCADPDGSDQACQFITIPSVAITGIWSMCQVSDDPTTLP